MATFNKYILSGSTSGKGILVAATSTPGTTIHTAHATALDEVWLWASDINVTDRLLTVEFGGNTGAEQVSFTVPSDDGAYLIIPGWIATGSIVIRAFAAAASEITIHGFVNRIT